jgi:hypothetical protein
VVGTRRRGWNAPPWLERAAAGQRPDDEEHRVDEYVGVDMGFEVMPALDGTGLRACRGGFRLGGCEVVHAMASRTVVPRPAALSTVNVAPMLSARSCMVPGPRCPGRSWPVSKPVPSSAMSISTLAALFSFMSLNWRGKPLESHEVIINLIAAATTTTGVKVHAQLDQPRCATKIEVTDEQLAAVNITRHAFHGDWNYTISPSITKS